MKKLFLGLFLLFAVKANASDTSGYCGPKDENGDYGTNCEWNYDETTKTLRISGTGKMFTTSGTHDHPWSKGTSYYDEIENVVIEEGITYIGGHAFYGAKKLKNIVLPDSLTSIGWNVFIGTNITSVVIPDSVTYIGGDETSHRPLNGIMTEVYCSKAQEKMCAKYVSWSGLDEGVLKTYQKDGSAYYYDGRFYDSPKDIGLHNPIKKRIYTIDEANKVTGKKNSVKIRYK